MARSKSATAVAVVSAPVVSAPVVSAPVVSAPVVSAPVVTTVTPEPIAPVSDLTPLVAARVALVDAVGKTGDVIKGYARMLEGVFNRKDTNGNVICKWYDLVGKEAKGLRIEKEAFFEAIKAKGFAKGTEYTYWQRTKEASGWQPKGRASGAATVDEKTRDELRTIINRILGAQEAGETCNKSEDILDALKECFVDVGGDLEKLKSGV